MNLMLKKISIVTLASFVLCGCFSQQYVAGISEAPVKMSGAKAEKQEYSVLKSFKVVDRSGWFILGLIPSGHTDIDKIVKEQVLAAGGDAVINLKIKTQYDFVDIIITALVGGIYNTRVTHLEGDVIKYN